MLAASGDHTTKAAAVSMCACEHSAQALHCCAAKLLNSRAWTDGMACCCWQVGNLKVTYSVHTQAGADLGGNVKENQVRRAGAA
jgi:hypothetical protein